MFENEEQLTTEQRIAMFKAKIKGMNPEQLQQCLKEVKADPCKGTPCEVFSRVVGYMRPVQNWNKGKKEEFAMRKMMKIENARPCNCPQ